MLKAAVISLSMALHPIALPISAAISDAIMGLREAVTIAVSTSVRKAAATARGHTILLIARHTAVGIPGVII